MLWMLVAAMAAPERVERGNLVLESVPETPAALSERLRRYQNVRSAGFVDFVGGGDGVFVSTRFGDTSQLHRVATPGGAREQVTFFTEPLRGASPSPNNPDRVLLTRDTGGDEQFQLWLLDLATGETSRISDGTGRVSDHRWSPDGSQVIWTQTTAGSGRQIVLADPLNPGAQRVVWKGEGAFGVLDWFPSKDQQVMLFEYVSAKQSRLHILPLKRSTLREVNPTRTPIAYGDGVMAPDGRSLFVSSDQDSEFSRLWRLDLAGGKHELLTPDVKQDVELVRVSPDGTHLIYALNDDGRSTLVLKTLKGFADVPLPTIPPGVVYAIEFDASGKRIGITLSRADAPSDVYTFEVGKTELVRWTKSEIGGLNPERFLQPEFFRYPSFDDLQIPAYVFRPTTPGPHPVVIKIHGGPEGQSRPYFSAEQQFFATELGLAVVVPNVRGSVGFGRSYHQADDDLKRKDSVKDIGALLDWIATQPDLDPERVVVYGGSYGGYMVLASLIDHADRLAGGIDVVGISDFKTFLANTKDYRRDLRRAEYGDERIPKIAEFFDEISPLKNAARIQDPLFVIQGANDPRVPASEAEQIVAAVRKNQQEAWYMLAKDEGHGFAKKQNRDAQTEAVVLFLGKVLGLPL